MRELAGQRVLVTGASGFIGANLTRALIAGDAEVHALARPRVEAFGTPEIPRGIRVHRADLVDRAAVSEALAVARPSVVFHLAASRGHPDTNAERCAAVSDTVLGTANLLEELLACRPERLVHVGSSLEYGHRARALREQDPLVASTFRGAIKAAATMLALAFGRRTGTAVTVLRPFSVYGPWEHPHRFVPNVVRAALRGEPIQLTPRGFRHDFVFVDDVVEACLRAAVVPEAAGEIFNVGTGRDTTNEEVVERLAAVAGRELDVRIGAHEPRPWDTSTWVADTRKAGRLLGWRARHDLDAGIAKTLAWFARSEAREAVLVD